MGVLSRLSNIVTANLHSLLDRAENLEAMLDLAIRDMDAGLARARRATAAAIAGERLLRREADRHRALAVQWRDRAREALAVGDEAQARQALEPWQEHDVLASRLDAEHAEADQASAAARHVLRSLESRLAEARRRRQMLVVRYRTAEVRIEVQRRLAGADAGRFLEFEERLRRRAEECVAEAELCEFGRAPIVDGDRQRAIDREFETLSRETAAASEIS
jgi:phage shock protein A